MEHGKFSAFPRFLLATFFRELSFAPHRAVSVRLDCCGAVSVSFYPPSCVSLCLFCRHGIAACVCARIHALCVTFIWPFARFRVTISPHSFSSFFRRSPFARFDSKLSQSAHLTNVDNLLYGRLPFMQRIRCLNLLIQRLSRINIR